MATNAGDNDATPALRDGDHFHAQQFGQKLVDGTQKFQEKANHAAGQDTEKKEPAGGFDSTPVPKAPPGYTVKITFHSAKNLPFADLSMTSDPYIHAALKTDLAKRHKQDPDLRLRTPTIHRNLNPVWNTTWTIAHVPASGFHLKCRLYDEDPTDHDDRLGNVHVDVGHIDENWKGFKEESFKVKKRMGSKRAYTLRGCAALVSRKVPYSGEVIISVENLGRSEGDDGGRAYTIAPLMWSQHHSPLIGMIAGTRDNEKGKDGKKSAKYNFRAVQMQLKGPVPAPLYHRYVEFKPFISGMFTSHTIRGRILNHAAHHQHYRIYNFDETTKYGSFDEPCREMSEKFLDFVHHDQGGRIFTYILTLDGQFRFTETGKEFGIDMLSKHTMHSNVSIYIAFSGEFFIRRLKNAAKGKDPDPISSSAPPPAGKADEKEGHKTAEREHDDQKSGQNPARSTERTLTVPDGGPQSPRKNRSFNFFRSRNDSHSSIHSHATQTYEGDDPSTDISHYELIIDNDSGTYRPNAEYLPELKKFFKTNFPGLKVVTLDCQKDEEKMKKLKSEQSERKKNSGQQIMYMQNSSMSSFDSSDEEELQRRVSGARKSSNPLNKAKRKVKDLVLDGGDKDGAKDSDSKKDVDKGKDHGGDEGGPSSSRKGDQNFLGAAATTDDRGSRPQTALSEANLRKNNLAYEQNQHPVPVLPKQAAPSDTEERLSFDTALTDNHHTEQFVTPKPSLGDGGLRQFTSKQALRPSANSNANDIENSEDAETPRGPGKQLGHANGDVTPVPNGYTITGGTGIHHAVTSAP